MDNDRVDQLRSRRSRLAGLAQAERNRERHGQRFVDELTRVVGSGVTLADFHVDREPPVAIDPVGLKDASQWAEVAVDIARVRERATCFSAILGAAGGLVGILSNDYLGLCAAERVSLEAMVEAADYLEEAIVFYLGDATGAIVIDCYKSPPGFPPFGLYVFGDALVSRLASCVVAPADQATCQK